MQLTPEQVKGRIKNVAKENKADARTLMRIYMMERFLERVASSQYKDNFIIKGGMLVTAMVGVALRSTMDIDTSIKNQNLSAEDAKRIVILSHGYRGSRFGTLSFMAKYLHEHQCDVLFIEHRCCGDSEGKYITFGAKEQWDVQQWAVYVSERNKEKLPIYLYGQSMGAAAVLMASGHTLPAEVKGLIADCGFQSMEGQMRDMAANWFHLHHIPLLLMELDWFCSLVAGFHMKDADTTEAMKKNTRPVLFFHGEKDTYVYPNNSFQNYMLCRAEKELVIIPGARHLCSAYADPELYQHKMMEFFEKYD